MKAEYSASNYRNPFLATAMVNLNMIDTVGSGILKMFLAQKKRCFPLPDYDFSNHEVRMKLYGKVLDINYTKRLLTEDLSLSEVFELDGKQKKAHATNNDMANGGNDLVNDPVNDILEILRRHPDYSYKQIAQTIEKSETTVKRAIAKLKSENKIHRIGSDKAGHWEIIC